MANFISGIISLSISVVVLANVFIFTVKNTSTTGWSASEVAMWGLFNKKGHPFYSREPSSVSWGSYTG